VRRALALRNPHRDELELYPAGRIPGLANGNNVIHPARGDIAEVVPVRPRWMELRRMAVQNMAQTLLDQSRCARQLARHDAGASPSQSRDAIDKMTLKLADSAAGLIGQPFLNGTSPGIADISVPGYCAALPTSVQHVRHRGWQAHTTVLPRLANAMAPQITPKCARQIRVPGERRRRSPDHTSLQRRRQNAQTDTSIRRRDGRPRRR